MAEQRGGLADGDGDDELLGVVAGIGSECRRWAEAIAERLAEVVRARKSR